MTERAPLAGLSKRLSRHWAPDRRTADDVAAYERAKRRAKAVVLQLRSYRRQASSKVRQAGKRALRRLRENITALSESLEGDHNVVFNVVMERDEAVVATLVYTCTHEVSLQQAQLRAHRVHDAPASRHGRPQVLYINLNGAKLAAKKHPRAA